MSLSLQLWSPSKLRRATCLACSPFIFAFIAFNILDLDGSNLASLTKCSSRLVIDADVGPSARVEPLPQRLEYFDNHRTLSKRPFRPSALENCCATRTIPSRESSNPSLSRKLA